MVLRKWWKNKKTKNHREIYNFWSAYVSLSDEEETKKTCVIHLKELMKYELLWFSQQIDTAIDITTHKWIPFF